MKIIYLINNTFSDRDYERYGIEQLKIKKINVEIWDFSILNKNTNAENKLYEKGTKLIEIKKFKNYKNLKNQSFKNKIIFDIRSKDTITERYNICWFKKNGAIIAKEDQGLMPGSVLKLKIIDRIRLHLLRIRQLRQYYFFNFINKFNFFKLGSCAYDIVISGGSASIINGQLLNIQSHARDFDIYLKINKLAEDKKYILFIDCGVTNHPDYKLLKFDKPIVSEHLYYKAMNSLFDKIENDLNLDVIISAHPKIRDIDKLSANFNNRKIMIDNTADMIRKSSMVITHVTTAINYAVLWDKPLLFVTTNEMNRNEIHGILSFKSILNIEPINADRNNESIDWIYESLKPKLRYNKYKDMFIKKIGTENKHSKDIFAEQIIDYFGKIK